MLLARDDDARYDLVPVDEVRDRTVMPAGPAFAPAVMPVGPFAETDPAPAPAPMGLEAAKAVVEAEVAAAATSGQRDLARVVLQILSGEKPRPVHQLRTARPVLVQMAGLPRHQTWRDRSLGSMLDRLVPLLDLVPGRSVRVEIDGSLSVDVPVLEAVRERVEAHLAAGGTIPTKAGDPRRISLKGVAQIVDRGWRLIERNPHAMAYLAEVGRRPGALGRARRRSDHDPVGQEFYARTMAWLRGRYDAKLPLPERMSFKSGDPDHEFIRRAVSPDSPSFVGRKEYAEHVAMHLRDFGVAPEGTRLAGPVTCDELVQHLQGIWRELKGSASAANLDTALGRVLTAKDLTGTAAVPEDLFADVDKLIVDAAAVDKPLAAASRSNLGSFVRFAAKHCDEALRRADDLPRDPAKALHLAILRSGKTADELAEMSVDAETGVSLCRQHIGHLRSTAAVLAERYEPCLLRLEEEVFHTGGRIAARFAKRSHLHDVVCTPYFRSLSWEVRRLLPEDAHTKSDDEVRALVRERETKVLRQDRMSSKVQSASRRVMKQLPEPPADAPVLAEIEEFVRYKKRVVPDLMRHYRGRWCDATAKLGRRQLLALVRFCAMDRRRGGLGKSWETVTLADVLNWKLVASYINWLAGRYADVEHDGAKRGAWLTGFDLSVVSVVISMLDPVNGYITQLRDVFRPRLAADEGQLPSFSHLEALRIRMQADTVNEDGVLEREEEFEETFSRAHVDRRVMPPEVVAAATDEWVMACANSRNRLSNLVHYLKRFIDKGRDPMGAISVIVKSKDPMSFLREILERAQSDIPNRHLKPYEHAVAVRDVLLFALLCLTGLRSKNLHQLLYDPQGGGHISLVSPEGAEGVDALLINIPWRNFKNLGSWHLFGRDGNKMDYERRLGDWYNVLPLFQHYVDVCRPYLISLFAERLKRDADPAALAAGLVRQTTRALFPIPPLTLMDCPDLTRICHDLTVRYHVMDPAGDVRPGRMKFGPHAVRDVLATHIIISGEEESRWAIAADLLQTSVEMVKEWYVKRTIQQRTGRADQHFAAASAGMPALQL